MLKYDASELMLAMNRDLDKKMVTAAQSALAGVFNVERVLVGQGFQNTADPGQPAAFGRFWQSGKVQVCHVNDDGLNGDLQSFMPQIGRTIWSTKGGGRVAGSDDAGYGSIHFDEYREESRRGSVFRERNKRGIKIFHKEAGHLLTGV